jgi:hypothetical protein
MRNYAEFVHTLTGFSANVAAASATGNPKMAKKGWTELGPILAEDTRMPPAAPLCV